MRRSTYAARSAGLIRTEALENRRLFAGMPFDHGMGRGDFDHHAGGPPGGPWAEAVVISLPLGGLMRVMSEPNSTTAFSSNFSAAPGTSAGQSAASENQPIVVRTMSAPRTGEAVAVAVRNTTPAVASETPVVQQVMPDTTAGAHSDTAAAAAAASASAVFDAASEPVFGPFILGNANDESAQRTRANGEGSLLNIDPDAVDRSLRWQSQDATYRPRRAASPSTGAEEVSFDVAARSGASVQQATLAPVPVELASRPLWQRLATVAAAGLLVVTNTIVRRRQRRAAAMAARS